MRKMFFAATVEAAVATARRELGEDALLVDVQQASNEKGAAGGYRVLFESDASQADRQTCPLTPPEGAPLRPINPGLGELTEELTRLSSLVACLAASGAGYAGRPELARMTALLQSFDLPTDQLQGLLSKVEQRLGREDRESAITQVVSAELRKLVTFHPGTEPAGKRTVVALVGPPGAGKTTMLVKLAMRLGIAARRSALVLTTDTYRVAAADQLRTYAGVLGLPFHLVESPGGLSSALAEHRQKDVILIDTPGFGPRDWQSAEDWAAMLDANPAVCVHLVLPATLRAADSRELVRRWAMFRPDQLSFTRMDETSAYGGCVAAALESRKLVSWFSTGQDIPEDLERATPEKLFGPLLGRELNVMAAVA